MLANFSTQGTHVVQRMTLLTLIILGEGIIVVCKSISKIVKNEYNWTGPVVGQVIAAILIIYFLYMSYFDRIHEEHFGTIKQQIWSFLHFPLHATLVLVLQGISILIIWRQAVEAISGLAADLNFIAEYNFTDVDDYARTLNASVYNHVFGWVPKGVDASKEKDIVYNSLSTISEIYDDFLSGNETAGDLWYNTQNELLSATFKTLFDSLGVTIPKDKKKPGEKAKALDFEELGNKYYGVFELVVYYVFIAVSFPSI